VSEASIFILSAGVKRAGFGEENSEPTSRIGMSGGWLEWRFGVGWRGCGKWALEGLSLFLSSLSSRSEATASLSVSQSVSSTSPRTAVGTRISASPPLRAFLGPIPALGGSRGDSRTPKAHPIPLLPTTSPRSWTAWRLTLILRWAPDSGSEARVGLDLE
jgi:hypothetical protein